MSATALQRAYQKIAQSNANRWGAPTLSPAASLYARNKEEDEEEKKKNRGGLLGGLGYVGEKLGLGLLQGIEGVWDYAAGGIASIFNANEWAEQQFSSDWLNYNHADDWYNPGEGWKVAGDVTGGIGTSVPAIVAAGLVTYATGGAALPIVGTALPGIVGIGVGSLSAAGTSTKEAMQESGELTAKEYLYGAGMGAVEAVTEKLSGGLGAGVTKAAKSVGKAFGKVAAKETAEAAAKSAAKKGVALSLKTAAKSARREFLSEAFEEGFSEWVAPYIARATYDPNAQSATGEEILYSAFIGGLSGVGTAGGVGAFTQFKNVSSGTVIADEGRAKQILSLAKRYTEDGFSNTEDAQGIREIYEKLAPAVERGEALNIEQRRMLGELNSFEMAEQLRPTLQRSALTAVQSADAIAERLNADGRYKMVNDKFTYVDSEQSVPEGATVRDITAEDITKGYDPSKKDSIRKAIQKNDVLRYIAASDAAGRFIMTAKDFEKAALSGQKIQSQADLNLFIENASAEQKAAVGRELGIEDWNTLNIDGFNEKTSAYRESGKAEAYKQKTAKIEEMKKTADSKPKSIPRAIALADGDVKHYADADSNIAIARTGDTFLVYDFKTGNVTRNMTRAEVNAELARYRQSKSASAVQPNATTEITNTPSETANATTEKTTENFSSDAEIEIKDEKISKSAFENEFSEEKSRPTVKEIKAANEAKEQAKRFDALAKEKIKDYDGLSEANKSMIRKIFREADANGISEADALSYARVSARTGLDIVFDKKACYKGKNEAGADVYHAGFYDPENNRIVVNPETKKKHTVLLIHELSHAMRSYRKNGEVKYFIDKDAKVSEKMWKEIRKYYADENGKVDEGLALDEASAYYAEAIFGTEGAIDLLLGEKPTLKQKILSFFAKSAEYYSTDEKLSREARRHFKKFKAMFDAFAARNFGRNAEGGDSNGSYRASMNIGGEKVDVTLDEDKDLVAIHNLTEKNLLDTLELGGFPMPSIAIIRKGQEHSKYGDISVIFGKETIDPKNSKYNKVYGGDAWTATYPRIEYKANAKVAKRINDKYYELEKKYGYDNVRAMYAYANELEERLNGLKGEEGLLEEIYDSTRMMQVYLLDSGKGRVETVTKEIRKEMTPSEVKMNEFLIKELGEEFIDAYKAPSGASPFTYVKEYVKENEGRIKEAFTKYLTEEANIDPGVVEKVVEQYKPGDYAKLLRDAYRYRHEGAVNVKVEDDPKATEAAIRKAADNEQYREWVDSLFKGAQEKTGIRNSKNYYDDYGNSRYWEQLHYENTIDNVIRVMREQVETGGQTIFSGNSIWGVAAKEYNSIDEVKADKERLKKLPEEEYKAMAEELGGRLEKIAQSIKSDSESNVFIAVDDAMSLIVDCVRECKTKASMLAYLKRYNKKATVQTVDDIVSLVRDIANMPTGYFEAKPRRAVDFSEIKMVELPESASDTLKAKLDENNIPYEVYGNTDQQRAEKIDKLKNVRFSMAENVDFYTENEYNNYGWARANNVLNVAENEMLRSRFAAATQKLENPYKTKSGEFMISIGQHVENKIVFMAGTIDNPIITRVIEMYELRGNELDKLRRAIYDFERRGIQQTFGEFFGSYSKSDFAKFEEKYNRSTSNSEQFGTQRGTGSRTTEATVKGKRSPLTPPVHTFKDVYGLSKTVIKIGSQYEVEGNAQTRLYDSIEAAVEAHNRNAIRRYANKYNTTPTIVKNKLASDPDFLAKERKKGKRFSMDNDYLDAVNRGDMVTAQRMVDEAAKKNGFDKLFYHGAKKGGGFTVFKDWSYFTENKQYAERYTDREKKGSLYTTYVRLENPFDTRKKADRAIFNDIRQEYGLSEIQDTGLPDWTDGYDISDYIDENELDYDGIVLDEGGDMVDGKPVSRGLSYVVRKSAQIKSADPVTYDDNGNVIPLSERFNQKKSDIRYSSETIENVGKSRFDEPDVKFREKIKAGFVSAKDRLYIDGVDELYGVEKYLTKFGGRKDADAFVQQVRASETISQTMIGVAQYDITSDKGKRLGDGLTKIFSKYKVRGISKDFDDYLLHQLNVDRMTLNERSLAWQEELRLEYEKAQKAYDKAKKLVEEKKKKSIPRKIGTALTAARNAYESFEVLENKPVFGENEKRAKAITADESRKIIAEYEKEHPEFKKSAEEVWNYSKNLQAMRVSAGLISQESADVMAKYYPHYVPAFRDTTKSVGAGTVKNASQLAVNSTIKSAKGGGEDVYSVEESLAAQTRQTVKAMQINRMANAVYDAAIASGDTTYVMTKEAEKQKANPDPDAEDVIDLVKKNNQIVFFHNGKKMEMNVAQEIFDGFKGVTNGSVPDSILTRASNKVLNGFKNLVTQLSPAFAVRNFVRDLQDAIINTKHPGKFIKQLKGALEDMAKNGNEWQLYLAYGGFASTVFDAKGFTHGVGERGFEAFRQISGIDESSFKKIGKGLKNVLTVVGNANAFIEQLTRFMEFKASLAAGDSIQTAINNSAEVTTNFSRHGKVVKVLNATFIPFLNASVQGFDKLLRVISGPFREQSLAAIAILFAKILAIGIAPQILNMLMYGDEEDYEDLTNEVRENYFLIKVGEQYIKIPRGRAAGAFGGIANRIGNVTRGDSFDLPGYLESLKNNVTPVDSFSRTIFAPINDVRTNTTWYGGEIEGRQFENVRPSQRYDESTSSIAVALGGAFNYSPKKIHYLLDQYSGVIGDFLLPVTTKKAEKDYLSANFLIDPKTNNKLSDEFYKLYDEAQFAKNEGDETAYYQLRHLNDVKDSVSKLYDDIESIQKSDKKNSDKLNEVRTIRALINNLYKTAKTDYAAYTKAIEATEGLFDETTESGKRLRYTVITQMMYGSEKALEEYNSDVYEKSRLFNKAGMSYDTFYEYYFTTKFIEADTDRKGEKIEGSKRKNTIAAINKLNATREEKLLMIVSSGYALKDGDIRGISAANAKRMLLKYILSMKGTQAEKAALAEACGFEVKNGKILKNSL